MQAQVTELAATGVVLAMLATAVVADLRVGKIFNWLTAPCAAVGIALGAAGGGLPGMADRLSGMAVVLVGVLLLSRAATVGGGDIKLLMAVGALKGFHFALWAMLLTGVLGGLVALVYMLRHRAIKETALTMMVATMVSSAGGQSAAIPTGPAAGKIPYSTAIALGTLSALALGM